MVYDMIKKFEVFQRAFDLNVVQIGGTIPVVTPVDNHNEPLKLSEAF